MDWETLRKAVTECQGCQLATGRLKTVFGVGDETAPVLFCGEAPGEQESVEGKPFVGKTGRYLRRLMQRAGFKRGDVFISNVLRCRPPSNRPPLEEEISACQEHLKELILLLKPKAVVCVGQISTKVVLRLCEVKEKRKISVIRGDWYDTSLDGHSLKVMAVWHPSYVLRSGARLREQELFRDLRRVYKTVIGADKDERGSDSGGENA